MDIAKNTRILILCVIIIVVAIYFPTRHARHYDYIENSKVLDELVASNSRYNKTHVRFCSYADIVLNNTENKYSEVYKEQKFDQNVKGR